MTEVKRITIGLFVDAFYPMVDGVIVVVDNYAKQLAKKANVIVFAPESRESEYIDNFSYQVIRSKFIKVPLLEYDLPLPALDKEFRKKLKNTKLDIVHIHSPFTMGRVGIKYAQKYNIPVVATIHSQYNKDFLERTKSKVVSDMALKNIISTFNKCDQCWAVNNEIAQIFSDFGIKKRPIIQLNATDLEPVCNSYEIEQLKTKYRIKSNEKVFLYVGRLDVIKNLDFTIQILHKLALQGFAFKMIFVGTGPFYKIMKKKIRVLDLDNIIFTGKITDRDKMAAHYKLADLFLFPSLYDSSSLVQIEAASQCTPSLFIKGAVTANTITDGVNGYLAENNTIAYAKKILDIFKDEEKHQEISLQAYLDLYNSWEKATKKVLIDYLSLIAEKKIE